MDKIIMFFVSIFIGEYILDEMTRNKRVEVLPSPFRWLRNKLLGKLQEKKNNDN